MKYPGREIGLDCDGILAHFAEYVIRRVHVLTGKLYRYEDITTWEIFDSITEAVVEGDTSLRDKVYAELRKEGSCSMIPVFEGAREGVEKLRTLAHVFIATAPFRPSRTWMSEREDWLYKHFDVRGVDVTHCSRKHRVFAHVFVDDKPETIAAWQAAHPQGLGLLWDAPYNRSHNLQRVSSWEELYAKADDFLGWLGT